MANLAPSTHVGAGGGTSFQSLTFHFNFCKMKVSALNCKEAQPFLRGTDLDSRYIGEGIAHMGY